MAAKAAEQNKAQTADSNQVLESVERLIGSRSAGPEMTPELCQALIVVVEWLAERVPYNVTLPRGYSLLWTAQKGRNGTAYRYHQLLKHASHERGIKGVWIDTNNLGETVMDDIKAFGGDLADGWLREIIDFLRNPPQPVVHEANGKSDV